MNKFCEILKILRIEKGISRKALAEVLSVSERLVGYWENGERECSLATLVEIADYFHVTTDYLLGRTEY